MEKKKWSAAPAWVGIGVVGAVALRSFLPDSTRGLFVKGQQLENLGQYALALRHYRLLSRMHPESPWAPRSIERQAAILASQGRSSGNMMPMREAMELYRKLAEVYTTSPLAADALVSAGAIAFGDLRDWNSAKTLYAELLARFPNSREYASQALVKLGRVALAQRDRDGAVKYFQSVLQRYAALPERCAEAQYHMGVAYETLWKDKQHAEWARNAYAATVKNYPQSLYARDAQARLGLLFYGEASQNPSSRRVLIDVPPIPDENSTLFSPSAPPAAGAAASGPDRTSMWAALRLLLSSRGLQADEVVLRGWSLRPFTSGFNPSAPSRVVEASASDWENILFNAGLRYVPSSGGKATEALRDLQREIDLARPPLLFNGKWSLAVGYDSSRGLVFLQSQGARIETLSTKELAQSWAVPAPISTDQGSRFAIIGAWAPNEKPQALPEKAQAATRSRFDAPPRPRALDAEAAPTPVPTATPLPRQDTATFIYALPSLSLPDAHRRALRRAGQVLARPRAGAVLLNAEALSSLASTLEAAARPPLQVQVLEDAPPVAPPAPSDVTPEDLPARASEGSPGDSPLPSPDGAQQPGVSPTAPPVQRRIKKTVRAGRVDGARRALEIEPWLGAPLEAWLQNRRDAAAFCERAGAESRSSNALAAARELRTSIAALEAARAAFPPRELLEAQVRQPALDDAARQLLGQVVRELRRARDAEKQAAALLQR